MQIKVGLLMFAPGMTMADYVVLLHKRNDYHYEILQKALPTDKDAVSIVNELIEDCSGVSSKWIGFMPEQCGFFDKVDRNPSDREIFVSYSLYIPGQMKVRDNYDWVKISELAHKKMYMDNEQIIINSILKGTNV